jgi:hypothetical protein
MRAFATGSSVADSSAVSAVISQDTETSWR